MRCNGRENAKKSCGTLFRLWSLQKNMNECSDFKNRLLPRIITSINNRWPYLSEDEL